MKVLVYHWIAYEDPPRLSLRLKIPGSAQGHRVQLTGPATDPAAKDKRGMSLREGPGYQKDPKFWLPLAT